MLAHGLVSTLLLVPALVGGTAASDAGGSHAPAAPPAEAIGEPIPETRSETPWRELFAVRLLAPSVVAPGEELRFRVVAYGPYDREPRADVELEAGFELKVLDGEERADARVTDAGHTDVSGVWVGTIVVPDDAVRADSGDLVLHARVGEQERRVAARVTVLGTRAFLSTDKTLYRPGERLRMRGLWAGSAPLPAGARARFEVADARGRRVFDAETSLSEHGIAHTAWEIPETITPGSYRVGAEVPGAGIGDSRRVRIAPFERAPFVVTAEPHRPVFHPAQDVTVAVEVRTLLGAPVPGARIELESEQEPEPRRHGRRNLDESDEEAPKPSRATGEGVTDADGRATVALDLGAFWRNIAEYWNSTDTTPPRPYRDVELVATVTHPVSGRRESARTTARLSPEPIHVYTPIRRPSTGRPLFVTTFGAEGEPRACRVWVTVRAEESRKVLTTAELETNRFGAGSIPWAELLTEAPPDPDRELLIELEAHGPGGGIGHRAFTSSFRAHPPALVLDAPRTLLAPGEPVEVTLRSRPSYGRVPGPVLIELQRDRRVLDSRRVDSLDGPVELELDPGGVTGPLVLGVYRLQPALEKGWTSSSSLASRRFLVLGAEPPPRLRLEADADEYRPGETAHVRLAVETADRQPPGPVALGVAAVDRAVELRQRREGLAEGPGLLEPLPRSRGRTLGAWSLERIARLEPDEVPEGLETAAEILLADVSPDYRPTDTDDPIGASRRRYESHFHRQFEPVDEALEHAFRWPRYVQPADVESLQSILAARGIELDALHDPWGNAYRFRVRLDGHRRRASAATAGRDGRWDTVDDFTVWSRSWRYARPVGEPIGWILEERLEAGELLRDLSALNGALAARGVDLSAERDPWGRFYRVELVSRRGHYGWEVWSAGPDADCAARPRWDRCGVRVWSAKVDYGRALQRALGPQMNRALEAVLETEGGRRDLAESAELGDLIEERIAFPWPDPWGRPFRLEGSLEVRYADLSVRRPGADGEGFLETEPVRARDLVLRIRSGGPDRRFGTDDDRTVTRWVVPLGWSGTDGRWHEIAAAAAGEGEGLLAGRVTDTDGAALPGVRIEVRGVGLRARTQFSGPGGRFNLHLPAGAYRTSLALEGFSTLEYQSVRVRAGHTTWIDVTLSPAAEEVITVTSQSPLLDAEPTPPPGPPERPPISTPRVRRDFPDTLLWLPEVVTDEAGEARIEIPLADTITTWNVAALASTPEGPVATGELALRVSRPFFVRPDPPQTVTAGDRLEVPVYATNLTDRPLELGVTLDQLGPGGDPGDTARAGFKTETRRSLRTPPGEEVRTDLPASFPEHGESLLRVTATGDGAGDAVEKTVEVRPDGREEVRVESRLVRGTGNEDGGAGLATVELRVPETAIPGTAALEIAVYPDLRSHLVAATAELLRRPTGGTEQVLSAAYPSLLLLEMLSGTEKLPDDLRHRARAHVATAVERLETVQRADGGVPYWKGSKHADVALTAYAVELLLDAAPDDEDVPHRARTAAGWLLRRQGEDGLWRDDGDDSPPPQPPPEVERREAALAAGALARVRARLASPDAGPGSGSQSPTGGEAHRLASVADRSIDRAFDALEAPAETGHDAYLTAVYALAAHAHGDLQRWRRATGRLRTLAVEGPSGVFWELRSNTPYAGWGLSGRAETTGLAVRALLADDGAPAPGGHAERGLVHLLLEHGGFGLWGSTQATVQALRALAAGLPAGGPEPDAAGRERPRLRLDGIDLGSPEPGTDRFGPRRIGPGDHPALVDLAPGRHRLEIRSGGSPWTLVQATVRAFVPWGGDERTADSSDSLVFERRCRPAELRPGETVECRLRAGRHGDRGRGMLVAELGLPPGAGVDQAALQAAVGRIDGFAHFEIRPSRVVLFLWPRARGVEVPVRFTPRFAADARSLRSVLYDDSNPTERIVLPPERFVIE